MHDNAWHINQQFTDEPKPADRPERYALNKLDRGYHGQILHSLKPARQDEMTAIDWSCAGSCVK